MLLQLGVGILALALSIVTFYVAKRRRAARLKVVAQLGTGVVIVAMLVVFFLSNSRVDTILNHTAQVSDSTVVIYEDSHYRGGTAVLKAVRGTDAKELWSVDSSNASEIRLYQGMILVIAAWGTNAHPSITALRPSDGHQLWQLNNLPYQSSFMLEGATVYVSYFDNETDRHKFITAYSLDTRQPLWAHPVEVTAEFNIVTSPNALYLLVYSQGIMALDPASGQIRWQQPRGNEAPTEGVALKDTLVVERQTSLTTYDAMTGQIRWSTPIPETGFVTPGFLFRTSIGLIFFARSDDQAIVMDAASGAVVWQQSTSHNTTLVDHAVAYLSVGGTSAYDIATGKILWNAPGVTGWVVGTNLLVTRMDNNDQLVLIDRTDGHMRSSIARPGSNGTWSSSFFDVRETLFAVSQNGGACEYECTSSLHAIDVSTGQDAWKITPAWGSTYNYFDLIGAIETH